MSRLVTGVVGTSSKENEHRLPIHPRHLDRIPEAARASLRLERGYGRRFGVGDVELEGFCGGLLTREEILAGCDVVVLPKPVESDFEAMRDGGVLWGWPHCVQQRRVTQLAIDKRLTLIAFEAMFRWRRPGRRGVHVFAKNNELAGYCAVLHAFELLGIDGHYGPRRRAAVLGFGSVSRGAVYALEGRGVTDITVYTQRPPHLVRDQKLGGVHLQMRRGDGGSMEAVRADGSATPLAAELARADVIVNGTLQDTDRPLMYLPEGEEASLRPGSLIVDVSCDLGMGFSFARPTTFEDPIFRAGKATYYAVDHTPTYLWDAASWEISESLLPYFGTVTGGPESWREEPVIDRAIEIRGGVIENPKILSFQRRRAEYPHPLRR
ncbi:MAG: alanine dehydrogenase [bacterium]|nr:alanine dehydrogenase [bacterium]